MRRHQALIVVASVVALVCYVVVASLASYEVASTAGTGYLVVLATVVVLDSIAHRHQGPRS